MIAVIMAGGRGTRIASVRSDIPKPMIPVCGKPILQRQIECLKRQGCADIILTVGYLGDVIRAYFGDGSAFGVHIAYVVENEPLGTAGALYDVKGILREDFLLVNGDILFDADVNRFAAYHKARGGMATLFTHPNDHPYDSGIVVSDERMRVIGWMNKEDERGWYQNRVNAGLHMLSPEALKRFTKRERLDLDRDILKPMIASGRLVAYHSPEYVKDMGTPDRYRAAERDWACGIVQAKNLSQTQKAVFFDRDGTLNRHVGFLRDIRDFELLPNAAEMVRKANENGYLAIVTTNQPVIARGEASWAELTAIHNKMETLLGRQGAYLDDIFVCPHHPDRGFAGERAEYKIDCDCRKPKPGMLLRAARKYNIDLSRSYMVGDSEADMEAGRAAGCACVRVRETGAIGEEGIRWTS